MSVTSGRATPVTSSHSGQGNGGQRESVVQFAASMCLSPLDGLLRYVGNERVLFSLLPAVCQSRLLRRLLVIQGLQDKDGGQ